MSNNCYKPPPPLNVDGGGFSHFFVPIKDFGEPAPTRSRKMNY